MNRGWGNFISRIGSLFERKQDRLDRSRLMGMYLDQANRPTVTGMRGTANRERQDGKFAQNRRRAVERIP
jgi:hypothetical protein